MYFPPHMVEATLILNGISCIITEELLINTNYLITRSETEQATTGIWDKDKHTFTDPNRLHNEGAMEGMLNRTVIIALDLDHDPRAALKNETVNVDEAGFQKAYTQTQIKDDEKVTIESRSRQIWRKFQAQTNTEYPPSINISPTKDP